MTYPIKTLKELRGKLKRLNLIEKPTPAELKEIKWVQQQIEYKESNVNK